MKQELHKELLNLKSSLANAENNDIYHVHSDYFEEMQSSVMKKIRKENEVKPFNIKWLFGIAASVVLLVGLVFLLNNDIGKDEAGQISLEDSYQYMLENIDDLDEESLIMFSTDSDIDLPDNDLPEDEIISDYLQQDIEDLTDEDIEQLF